MRRAAIVIGVSFTLICLFGILTRQAVKIDQEPEELMRLHITANSNSLADQYIKRRVRKTILASSRNLFTEVTNISQAKRKIDSNLPQLTKRVQQKLYALGVDYKVQLKVKQAEFPRRSYGNLTLPAGKYQALNVVLGQGAGENWWCVLFPPLCLVNGQESPQKQSNQEKLKLSTKLDEPQKTKQPPVKFKLKLTEYLQDNPDMAELKGKLGNIFWFGSH